VGLPWHVPRDHEFQDHSIIWQEFHNQLHSKCIFLQEKSPGTNKWCVKWADKWLQYFFASHKFWMTKTFWLVYLINQSYSSLNVTFQLMPGARWPFWTIFWILGSVYENYRKSPNVWVNFFQGTSYVLLLTKKHCWATHWGSFTQTHLDRSRTQLWASCLISRYKGRASDSLE
jgi:hypothetical protein